MQPFSMHLVKYPEENLVLDRRILVKKPEKLFAQNVHSRSLGTLFEKPRNVYKLAARNECGAYHIMQRLKTANYGL